MKKLSVFILSIFISGFVYAGQNNTANDGIKWMSFSEAIEKNSNSRTQKKIFIDVYTDWCGWCRRMEQNTYSHPFIIEYVNKHFHPVKLNAEMREPVTVGDQVYRFVESGRRGYHELAANLLQGRLSYPSVVFLDESNNLLQPLPGYREPKDLHKFLQFFGENFYTNTEWEAFESNYQSPIR